MPGKLEIPQTNEISISELKNKRKEILSQIQAPVSVFDTSDSSSAKEILEAEWNTYCTKKGINSDSKSAFKRWKLEKQDSEITRGISPEWGETILKANKVTNKILNDSLLFKQNLLSQGPLGTENQGENKLGQGFEQTAVHFAITKVPGAVIAQQIIRDSGSTDFITVETWKTAREQMNPTSVAKQGKGTIGNYKLLTDKNIIDSYKAFITKPDNKKCFGCPVAPTLSIHQIGRFSYNNSICIYNYDTKNQNFEFDNRNLEFGAGTDIGVPNSEIENDIIKEISCMTCWLCNLPLVKQSPMKEGKPHGNPEPPHTEHVLNILDALFYLDLFETKDTQLMIDYNSYLEAHYYGENISNSKSDNNNNTSTGNWGTAPSKQGFLEYINNIYNTDGLLTIYPGISSFNEAWLKIHDFKFEYLYAHPDCNYEKNDDSLLCIDIDAKLVFNKAMAKNLADRIWKKRLTPTGGLLDVLGLVSLKTKEYKNQWKNNVLASWEKRLKITAEYINFKRGENHQEKSFYGFASLCSYIVRLPNTIKDVMINHKSVDFDEKLTLEDKNIPIVPTGEMLLTIIQILSYQIGNLALNKIKLDDFKIFCELKSTESIINSIALPERTRKNKSEAANTLKQQFQIVVFHKLFEKFKDYLENVVKIFSRLFYSLPDQKGDNRNIIVSLVIAKAYIAFIDIFADLVNKYDNKDSFKNELSQYLENEKKIKETKIYELIAKCNQCSITTDSLNDNTTTESSYKYFEDCKKFNELYKDNPINKVVSSDFDDSTNFKSNIPEKLKEQAETTFSDLLNEGNNKIEEQNLLLKIELALKNLNGNAYNISELKSSNENIDDVSELKSSNENIDDISELKSSNENIDDVSELKSSNENIDDISELKSSNENIDDIILLDNKDTLYDDNYKKTLVLIGPHNESKTIPTNKMSILTNRMSMLGIKMEHTKKLLTRKEFFDTYQGDDNNKIFSLEINGEYENKSAGKISLMLLKKKINAEFIEIIPIPMGGGRKTKRRTRRHNKTRKHNKKRVSRKYIR